MRKPQRGYARQDRVKEQIMREMAELVRQGLKDPRAGFITINDVEITRDYSHATIYYTVLDDIYCSYIMSLLRKNVLFRRSIRYNQGYFVFSLAHIIAKFTTFCKC